MVPGEPSKSVRVFDVEADGKVEDLFFDILLQVWKCRAVWVRDRRMRVINQFARCALPKPSFGHGI
eukprot:350075-Chlamydomonas_euryale.AAC.2